MVARRLRQVPPRVPTAAPSERIAPCTEAARVPRLPPWTRSPERAGLAPTLGGKEGRPGSLRKQALDEQSHHLKAQGSNPNRPTNRQA